MTLWLIIQIIDWALFVLVAITVAYFLVFAVASLFRHRDNNSRHAKTQNRFIVLIPSYGKNLGVRKTVNAILGQSYPQRMFDVVVIADHQDELTNMQLAQLPITLLTPDFDQSSKAKSLQYAIFNLPKFKIYDAVIILDSGNIVKPEFLDEVNDAFTTSGTKAMQVHRLSANRDTSSARLDSIFEEVNNSIFRRGHQVLGLSASLAGSGIVFDFQWFRQNIMRVRSAVGEDKALEAMLMRENIFVDYFENIHVYDEKTRQMSALNDQRSKWIYTQLHALGSNLRYLPKALMTRNYDMVDKLLQWALIPRTILIGIIGVMSIVMPFIWFSEALKWWIAAAVILFAFSLATPDYLVDKNWDKDFLKAPLVSIGGLMNIFRAGHTEATDRMTSASSWIKGFKGRQTKKKHKKHRRI